MTNDKMIDRPMRESVRTIDAIESKNSGLFKKSAENQNFIDKEARNAFPNGLSAEALKCSFGLSMHEKRECQVNELAVDESYPRCSKPEDWNNVVQCSCI